MSENGLIEGDFSGGPRDAGSLSFKIFFYTNGVARLRIAEKTPRHGERWQVASSVVVMFVLISSASKAQRCGVGWKFEACNL